MIITLSLGTKRAFKKWVLIALIGGDTTVVPVSRKQWLRMKSNGIPVQG